MANNQEFNSIDELFRKSFNDLPATPASNGWDTPSDRVWENIHSNVQPASGGWSAGTKLLIGASLSALLLVGAYWAFNRPAPTPASTAPVEQPAPAPTQPAPAASVTDEAPATKPVDHAATAKVKAADKPAKTPAAKTPETTNDANNSGPKNTAEKGKPAPNSIEKRKLEQVKQEQY
jgi:hypothetical protein